MSARRPAGATVAPTAFASAAALRVDGPPPGRLLLLLRAGGWRCPAPEEPPHSDAVFDSPIVAPQGAPPATQP